MTLRKHWHQVLLFALAAVIFGLDQYTKSLVRAHLPLNESWNPIAWLDPIVTLTHVRNTGAAFGLLPGMGVMFILVAIVVIALIVLFYRRIAQSSLILTIALGLQLGGSTGNLLDRLVRGYVTDFVDFRWWPVWNVADASLVVGAILLGIYTLFLDRESAPQRPAEGAVEG